MKTHSFIVLVFLIILSACHSEKGPAEKPSAPANLAADPLPSWNEGANKSAIISFVEAATDTLGQDYIPKSERIACFDNDGTLWSEKPLYFQMFFALDRIKEMAKDHPEWQQQQPYQAVLENDMIALSDQGEAAILELILTSHTGMSTEAFEKEVNDWIAKARHPKINHLFTELVYQPMLELLAFMQQKDFKTYIVSGGGTEFIRPWAEAVYGIPREQVIGSSIQLSYENQNGQPYLLRMPAIDFIDDQEGKVMSIHKFIGRKPVFCVGNSDGDLNMMQWTDSNPVPHLNLYIHHTDSVRESAYDRQSHIGRLDKGLDEASAKGWMVIDMEKDWKYIYPFEVAP